MAKYVYVFLDLTIYLVNSKNLDYFSTLPFVFDNRKASFKLFFIIVKPISKVLDSIKASITPKHEKNFRGKLYFVHIYIIRFDYAQYFPADISLFKKCLLKRFFCEFYYVIFYKQLI